MDWTEEQKKSIETNGNNLLIAAAAGSGKTAVLVERIIHKIIYEKIDIDQMLIVTFTNAAASEMREKILDAIYKKIEENPNDMHLQKQITLLNKASICTIHSFCLDVIKNYFYEIDISNNFQIGDTTEMELLKQEVLEELFDEKYNNKDSKFLKLVDTYANYRGDEKLKDLILKIYTQIQSNPFPKKWINEKVEMFNLKNDLDDDFSKTIWGKLILKDVEEQITENKLKLEKIYRNLLKEIELEKFSSCISNDIQELEKIENILNTDSNIWDKTYSAIQDINFDKWPIDRKVNNNYKDEAKLQRDKIKKSIAGISNIMLYNSKDANTTIYDMYEILIYLKELVLEFDSKFAERKREINKIDFNDIEHFALKILTEVDEKGIATSSKVAKELQERFKEIAIDEYQDSNLVQEYILNSVSNKKNIFMVGDIKQSIYRFREARPELFIEKYKKYEDVGKESTDGNKIKLFKNFRSRKEVLDLTNWIFESIMSDNLGNVEYTEDEFLNLGATYEENSNMKPELHILDLLEEESEEIDLEDLQKTSKDVCEAKFVANKIEELLKNNFEIEDKKQGKRKIEYKDIVILLRSTKNVAPVYEKELSDRNIPVFSDTTAEYLETVEIQTIISLLKIIDNPMQDIPLVNVMRSPIGNFTDNELIEIRLQDMNEMFYEALLKARISVNNELKSKIEKFLELINTFRNEEKELPLDELIWKIYSDTNYYNYVGLLTNGALRQANLQMLFERAKQYEKASFKGLYNFIHFIDKLRLKNTDMSSAKIVGENDNVVRIMSIHKSKGLEFPVVFLCNTSKKFNRQDLNDTCIIDQDLGFGVKNVNADLKIEYPTLSREAIKIKTEQEMLSEEMRILYVALTRAREKLIITATVNDFNKYSKDKENVLDLYKKNQSKKIEERLVKKCNSYLDWITLVMTNDLKQDKIELKVHKQNGKTEEEKLDKAIERIVDIEEDDIEKIREQLEWEYPYLISSTVPTKTSVSKIKEQKQEDVIELEEILKNKKETSLLDPEFVKNENTNISSSRKGTLIHLIFQKLNEKNEYTENDLKILLQDLVNRNIILKNEADSIPMIVITKYLKSNLWKELKLAKEVHKEEPFYLYLPANRINENYSKEDNILVQGVIDLYFVDKNNNLVLVDYKTDYVQDGEEEKLIERYEEQLNLYKEALEKGLKIKVDKVLIYSTYLGEIEIK